MTTKEEDRLRTANVHATLSVACLAAAIAGIAANSTKEAAKDVIPIGNGDGGKVAWDKNMGDTVASAAALIATVCAETAESIGANKAHVASAVNSGLAAQTPVDIITLTATAATCDASYTHLNFRIRSDYTVSLSVDHFISCRWIKLMV